MGFTTSYAPQVGDTVTVSGAGLDGPFIVIGRHGDYVWLKGKENGGLASRQVSAYVWLKVQKRYVVEVRVPVAGERCLVEHTGGRIAVYVHSGLAPISSEPQEYPVILEELS